MIHEILTVGPLQCNCSVIGEEASREAIVIDPGDDVEDVLALVRKHQLQVKQIVVTHAHIDSSFVRFRPFRSETEHDQVATCGSGSSAVIPSLAARASQVVIRSCFARPESSDVEDFLFA